MPMLFRRQALRHRFCEQETRLSLTNRATRLEVSQGHKHGIIPLPH